MKYICNQAPPEFDLNLFGDISNNSDGKITIVSKKISPLIVNRPNVYSVFFNKKEDAEETDIIRWQFFQNEILTVDWITKQPEIELKPDLVGICEIKVTIFNTEKIVIGGAIIKQAITISNPNINSLLLKISTKEQRQGINPDAIKSLIDDYDSIFINVTESNLVKEEQITKLKKIMYMNLSKYTYDEIREREIEINKEIEIDNIFIRYAIGKNKNYFGLWLELIGKYFMDSPISSAVLSGENNQNTGFDDSFYDKHSQSKYINKIDVFLLRDYQNIMKFPKSSCILLSRVIS